MIYKQLLTHTYMIIIPKPEFTMYPGAAICADRIAFLPSQEGIVLQFVDSFSKQTLGIPLSKVAQIVDCEIYEKEQNQ